MSTPISQWPLDDRPREKLLSKGAGTLSDAELLAILLRTGHRGESALDVARSILVKFGTFRQMSGASWQEWRVIKGMGPAKLAQIIAALEIGRRFRENEIRSARSVIKSSQEVADLLSPQLRDLPKEVFKTVLLDAKNFVISVENSAEGTVNQAVPFVREICHCALQKHAVSIICCHNHPSGDPNPSSQDKHFTQELKKAGALLQIKMLDHIIIGDNRFYSFADAGEL